VTRDARRLTADDLRILVRVLNSEREEWWDHVDTQGALDMYWAYDEAGWVSWQSFWEEDQIAARRAYAKVCRGVARREAADRKAQARTRAA
jgi:hypothetical protein